MGFETGATQSSGAIRRRLRPTAERGTAPRQRRQASDLHTAVDVATIADARHPDNSAIVVHFVDYAIVAPYLDPPRAVSALYFFASAGAWLIREAIDCVADTGTHITGQSAHAALSARVDLDLVGHSGSDLEVPFCHVPGDELVALGCARARDSRVGVVLCGTQDAKKSALTGERGWVDAEPREWLYELSFHRINGSLERRRHDAGTAREIDHLDNIRAIGELLDVYVEFIWALWLSARHGLSVARGQAAWVSERSTARKCPAIAGREL